MVLVRVGKLRVSGEVGSGGKCLLDGGVDFFFG